MFDCFVKLVRNFSVLVFGSFKEVCLLVSDCLFVRLGFLTCLFVWFAS